jgi:hypothetical protein
MLPYDSNMMVRDDLSCRDGCDVAISSPYRCCPPFNITCSSLRFALRLGNTVHRLLFSGTLFKQIILLACPCKICFR